LDFWVSAGHYLWHREEGMKVLPLEGDLEQTALPMLAARGLAWAYRLEPKDRPVWLTINTYKDLLHARRVLSELGVA